MTDDSDQRREFLARVQRRHADVQVWLRTTRPKAQRRVAVTMVLSSMSAAFTAGPALGGNTFADAVANALGLAENSIVWRLLCLAALVVSVGAAVLVNLERSQNTGARVGAAESAAAELDGLATLVQVGHLPIEEAAKLYQQYTVKIPFVADGVAEPYRAAAP
ncbi:hypothetical protein OF117_08510 [Geodermatophilus sp. YIM 151500]|uniref:hypothetical protein n=1 Tax=Geodermatophilus sp. YIM 151500 TaxID=2984531 RepID=UPI0021E42210|nr:hypothetical protein [Geodermatophilus sp. YIM 151500]MCV2489408.1 hypothetical protein [Geodermatophilus sp. YIM 151500]